MIEELIEELKKGKEAQELLLAIWSELGPYTDKLSPVNLERLNKLFKFDDSE